MGVGGEHEGKATGGTGMGGALPQARPGNHFPVTLPANTWYECERYRHAALTVRPSSIRPWETENGPSHPTLVVFENRRARGDVQTYSSSRVPEIIPGAIPHHTRCNTWREPPKVAMDFFCILFFRRGSPPSLP